MDRRDFVLGSAGVLGGVALLPRHTHAAAAETYRVAIIGHTGRGNYGHGLDTLWQRVPRTTLVAVADPDDAGRAKELRKLGLEPSSGYRDYQNMLSVVRPDLVAVCPRHLDQHHAMILASIRAGAKGIYVEKPFVRSPHEADEVLSACEKFGGKVAVAHRNRYHPVMKTVAEMMKDGTIGRVLEIRARGKGDRRGGGEDLWVLGSHIMNMIHFLAGKPRSCSAVVLQEGRRIKASDVHEGAEGLGPLAGNEVHARFLMEDGLVAYFDSIANDQTANHGFGLQVIGSKARIAIHADLDPLAHLIPGNPFEPQTDAAGWIPITTGGVGVVEPDPDGIHRVQHHDAAAMDLIESIEAGRQPLCDASEAAVTVEMICSVFESHRLGGRAVSLPMTERSHPLTRM